MADSADTSRLNAKLEADYYTKLGHDGDDEDDDDYDGDGTNDVDDDGNDDELCSF